MHHTEPVRHERARRTVRTFDQGLKRNREPKAADSNAVLLACGGTLIQAHENRVVALDNGRVVPAP